MLVVSSSSSKELASKVAKKLNARIADFEVKRFADGEIYIRAKENMENEQIVLIGNTHPDENLVELLFMQDLIRDLTGDFITVIPYYGYARQDRRFLDGESIASKTCAKLLEVNCNRIITVNLHKDDIRNYFKKEVKNLIAGKAIAELADRVNVDVVLSPDMGSFYLAKDVGDVLKIESAHFDKKRINDRSVESTLNVDVKGKNVLLVDDIISTGSTIIAASKILRANGAKSVHVVCVHGLFLENSIERIKEVCDSVNASDTLKSKATSYSVASLIADAVLSIA
jgi:ribose-phosphate pyrophosphokinase